MVRKYLFIFCIIIFDLSCSKTQEMRRQEPEKVEDAGKLPEGLLPVAVEEEKFEVKYEDINDPKQFDSPRIQFWGTVTDDVPSSGLWSIKIDGTDIRKVPLDQIPEGKTAHKNSVRSPDNRYLLTASTSADGWDERIMLIDLKNKTSTIVANKLDLHEAKWGIDGKKAILDVESIGGRYMAEFDLEKRTIKKWGKGSTGRFFMLNEKNDVLMIWSDRISIHNAKGERIKIIEEEDRDPYNEGPYALSKDGNLLFFAEEKAEKAIVMELATKKKLFYDKDKFEGVAYGDVAFSMEDIFYYKGFEGVLKKLNIKNKKDEVISKLRSMYDLSIINMAKK